MPAIPVANEAPAAAMTGAAMLDALLQPWRELHRLPPLSWLQPELPVCLLQADGGRSLWVGDTRRSEASAAACEAARFLAVEVPADDTLECDLPLPPMPERDRAQAVALAVQLASPFDPAELVWGWRARPAGALALLCTRKAVQARLDAAAAASARAVAPEVWALDGRGQPVVLQGFGESARRQHGLRGRRLGALLLLGLLVLAAAVLLTPSLQLRQRALQAQQAYDQAQQRLAPVLAQREALTQLQAQQAALREQMAERVEPLAVLDLLTQAVPEDSFVQRLQVQGDRLTLSGQTPNTAALMNRLSAQPLLRDVRSPTAATRSMSAGRENFTLEMTLQPDALRPPAASASASASAAAAREGR